jgi:hypothetical protein
MYQRWLTASLSGGSGPVGGSVLFDHNGYLRNQDQLVSRLLNDLVAPPTATAATARLERDLSATPT